ncbi:MAG: glycosyltransferase family 2 protein [Gammaproteobacteria bacterium]
MNICIIIPVYNHEGAITRVLASLKPYGLPCFLVNDGSSEDCARVLRDCAGQEPGWLRLIDRSRNEGKGAACMDGFRAAIRQGFTHAIQIDADGQHSADDIPRFLEKCRLNREALILGQPVFDGSAPASRKYGRQLTNLWIWINTLSFDIADGMCGFRLYPLASVDRLMKAVNLSKGMAFDIDIAVRLCWSGVETVNIPVKVCYPYDGVSHFRLWRDNAVISLQHARLFLTMLMQLSRSIFGQWR